MLIFKRVDYYHKKKEIIKRNLYERSKQKQKYTKKCMILNVSKPRVIIPQENKQNKNKSLKNGKNQKKFFYFQFTFFEIILAKVIQSS